MKKKIALILTAIIAISILSLAATTYAMPFMRWKNFSEMPGAMRRIETTQSCIRIDGIINKWGTTNVTGTIGAQSRTFILNSTNIRQGSSATAIWTTTTLKPISGVRAKENFTYTFYTANLVNASISSLNVTGYSFFLNGTWNVNKVTSTFTIITDTAGNIISFHRSQDGVAQATNAYGELKVTNTGSTFTLSINGVDQVAGFVRVQRIGVKMFNPFKIFNNDTSTVVTKADLSSMMSAFGSSPGWGNYNQLMDYNFNNKVDICDLTTAAANVDS